MRSAASRVGLPSNWHYKLAHIVIYVFKAGQGAYILRGVPEFMVQEHKLLRRIKQQEGQRALLGSTSC